MSDCDCEGQQQSEHSPGVVESGEDIVCCLVHPVDISDPVTFAQADGFMSSTQLLDSKLSVARGPHTSREEFQRNVIDVRLAKPGRTFVGCLSAKCLRLRDLTDGQGRRTICVLDAGYEYYTGNAHLGYSAALIGASKNARKAAKADMIKVFTVAGVLKLEDCFVS